MVRYWRNLPDRQVFDVGLVLISVFAVFLFQRFNCLTPVIALRLYAVRRSQVSFFVLSQ
jgi:hypothetical protein